MIDKSSANPAAIVRMPDVRLTDIETDIYTASRDFEIAVEKTDRAMLIFALRGSFAFEPAHPALNSFVIVPGTAVGLQQGLAHRWRGIAARGQFELFVSSIRRKAALLQGLDNELLVVPPGARPSATIIRHAVAIHAAEYRRQGKSGDDMIIRRCAEIVMAELVRYAQAALVPEGAVPSGIAHDDRLLRAWAAYFAEPRRRWTVRSLADAAGLSRTAFAERFRAATGVPPLTAITDLRLDQAVTMLREESAPLIEIAFTVGYNSEAAFVRAFHRKFGVPPGQYRKREGRR